MQEQALLKNSLQFSGQGKYFFDSTGVVQPGFPGRRKGRSSFRQQDEGKPLRQYNKAGLGSLEGVEDGRWKKKLLLCFSEMNYYQSFSVQHLFFIVVSPLLSLLHVTCRPRSESFGEAQTALG